MPDITMCMTKDCPKKETCYRAQATPDKYMQSYSDFKEVCNEKVGYGYFWETVSSKSARNLGKK